jgi:hypothetical protein
MMRKREREDKEKKRKNKMEKKKGEREWRKGAGGEERSFGRVVKAMDFWNLDHGRKKRNGRGS